MFHVLQGKPIKTCRSSLQLDKWEKEVWDKKGSFRDNFLEETIKWPSSLFWVDLHYPLSSNDSEVIDIKVSKHDL